MFRVEGFERIGKGNYRVILSTDDPGLLPALRFLRRVSAVAEKLDERIDLRRRVLILTEKQIAREPVARARRAQILAVYRELPGARKDRLKQLRKILVDQGERFLYDDVLSVISLAVKEERDARKSRAVELHREGLTCREIGARLGISRAQACRLAGVKKADRVKCPRIDDLLPGTYQRAVFPDDHSTPEGKQRE